MNSNCMLNFLSIIQSVISVMHFALLFLHKKLFLKLLGPMWRPVGQCVV